MKIFQFPLPLIFLFLIFALLIPTGAQAEDETTDEPAIKSGATVLALNVFDLKLDFDTTMEIQGETRFFSSRHNKYVGGHLMVHMADNVNEKFYIGSFTGIAWGKSSFLMNWEEPGIISFEPLESSVSTFYWPFGMDLNFNLGGLLKISPYASAKLMFLRMNVEIGDDDFDDTAIKLGFDVGARVTISLGKFAITAGAGLTHILNDEIEFELDDSVTFDSRTTGSSPEYFLGVEL